MIRLSKPQVITALIFLFILLLRIPGLDNSPAEYHSWRQSDTEAIARNFIENKFNIFYPQLNYDGPLPNYAQLEFQITTFIIACLYRLFGYHYYLARIVPLLFFCGSAYYLYLLAKKIAGELIGRLTLLVYGTFPFCIYFSRAIMPESAALFFMVAGLYYFLSWQKDKGKISILVLSAGLMALAVSQKIPTCYIGVPMVYLILRESGSKALKDPYVWGYALIALLPPFSYFVWLQGVAETDYVSGIAANLLFPADWKQIYSPSATNFLTQGLLRAYTPLGLGLALSGLVLINRRDPQAQLLTSWAIAAVFEIVFVAAIIQLDYYLLLIAPIIALLAAVSLQHLYQSEFGRVMMCGFVLVIVLMGWQQIALGYQEEQIILDQARALQEITMTTELLVIGTYRPDLLNLSHRYGWRANLFYPQDPKKELEFFLQNRATYFVIVNGQIEGDQDGSYYRYVQENYREIALPQGISVFKLQ